MWKSSRWFSVERELHLITLIFQCIYLCTPLSSSLWLISLTNYSLDHSQSHIFNRNAQNQTQIMQQLIFKIYYLCFATSQPSRIRIELKWGCVDFKLNLMICICGCGTQSLGLSNPFVSEYPIARLSVYSNEIFGLVRFQWGSAIVSSISFEGELIKFEPGLNSLPLCLD